MTATIEEMIWRNKGEAICASLKAYGLNPVWLEVAAGRIAVGFEFITSVPTWTRAFYVDAASATPQAFVREINAWKAEMRRKIATGAPSTVIEGAVRAHGLQAVTDAMEDTRLEAVN